MNTLSEDEMETLKESTLPSHEKYSETVNEVILEKAYEEIRHIIEERTVDE